MAGRKQTITLGIALAVAILAAVAIVWIAVPLFVLAVFLFAWGLEQKRTEAFVGRLPSGNYLLNALAKIRLDNLPLELRELTAVSFNYTEPIAVLTPAAPVPRPLFAKPRHVRPSGPRPAASSRTMSRAQAVRRANDRIRS